MKQTRATGDLSAYGLLCRGLCYIMKWERGGECKVNVRNMSTFHWIFQPCWPGVLTLQDEAMADRAKEMCMSIFESDLFRSHYRYKPVHSFIWIRVFINIMNVILFHMVSLTILFNILTHTGLWDDKSEDDIIIVFT